MTAVWKDRIRRAIEAKEMTMKAVSLAAGKGETFVRDMLERDRAPSIDNFIAIARIVEKPISFLLGEDAVQEEVDAVVPVMGYLGAGSEIEPEFEQIPHDGLDQIIIPFPLPAEMIAFEVRGISMLPVYKDGHIVVVYREQKRPIEAFYGQEVAVRTSDGRRFIKTLMRGAHGVNLMSFNAPLIEDVEVEWIGEIFAILPKASIKKIERVGGIQGRLPVSVNG